MTAEITPISDEDTKRTIGQERMNNVIENFYKRASDTSKDIYWFEGWFQFATHEPFEAVDFLMSEIVDKGRCVGCAACVEVCPVNVFD